MTTKVYNFMQDKSQLIRVILTFHKLELNLTSEPCKIHLLVKRGNRKTETSKEHLLENKIASINESVEFETIMHLEKFKPEYIAKPTSIHITAVCNNGQINVGSATFDLAHYLNQKLRKTHLVLGLEKCSDKKAKLCLELLMYDSGSTIDPELVSPSSTAHTVSTQVQQMPVPESYSCCTPPSTAAISHMQLTQRESSKSVGVIEAPTPHFQNAQQTMQRNSDFRLLQIPASNENVNNHNQTINSARTENVLSLSERANLSALSTQVHSQSLEREAQQSASLTPKKYNYKRHKELKPHLITERWQQSTSQRSTRANSSGGGVSGASSIKPQQSPMPQQKHIQKAEEKPKKKGLIKIERDYGRQNRLKNLPSADKIAQNHENGNGPAQLQPRPVSPMPQPHPSRIVRAPPQDDIIKKVQLLQQRMNVVEQQSEIRKQDQNRLLAIKLYGIGDKIQQNIIENEFLDATFTSAAADNQGPEEVPSMTVSAIQNMNNVNTSIKKPSREEIAALDNEIQQMQYEENQMKQQQQRSGTKASSKIKEHQKRNYFQNNTSEDGQTYHQGQERGQEIEEEEEQQEQRPLAYSQVMSTSKGVQSTSTSQDKQQYTLSGEGVRLFQSEQKDNNSAEEIEKLRRQSDYAQECIQALQLAQKHAEARIQEQKAINEKNERSHCEEIAVLRSKYDTAVLERNRCEAELQELLRNRDQLNRNSNLSKDNEKQVLQNELQQYKEMQQKLESRLREQDKELQKCIAKVEQLENQKKEYHDQLTQQKERNQECQRKVEESEQELAKLQKIRQEEENLANAMIENLQQQLSEKKSKEMEEYEEEIKALPSQRGSNTSDDALAQNLQKKVVELNAREHFIEDKQLELERKLKDYQREKSLLDEQKKQMQVSEERLALERQKLMAKMQQSDSQSAAVPVQQQQLEEEQRLKQLMQSELEQRRQIMASLELEKSNNQARIAALTADNDSLKSQMKKQKQESDKLKSDLKTAQNELQMTKDELETVRDELQTLQQQQSTSTSILSKSKVPARTQLDEQEHALLLQRVNTLEEQQKQGRADLERKKQEIAEKNRQIEKIQAQNEDLMRIISENQQKSASLENQSKQLLMKSEQLEIQLITAKNDLSEALNVAFERGGKELVDFIESKMSFRERTSM